MSIQNKSKFNIGDKVKITGESNGHSFKIGSTGVVLEVRNDDDKNYLISGTYTFGNSGAQVIMESTLELESPTLINKNARKWLEALRSGKFKQTKHRLRADLIEKNQETLFVKKGVKHANSSPASV